MYVCMHASNEIEPLVKGLSAPSSVICLAYEDDEDDEDDGGGENESMKASDESKQELKRERERGRERERESMTPLPSNPRSDATSVQPVIATAACLQNILQSSVFTVL